MRGQKMEKFSVFLADWQVLFREGIHFTLSGEKVKEKKPKVIAQFPPSCIRSCQQPAENDRISRAG
jgi:hypothetical protein